MMQTPMEFKRANARCPAKHGILTKNSTEMYGSQKSSESLTLFLED